MNGKSVCAKYSGLFESRQNTCASKETSSKHTDETLIIITMIK